jgi:hypothetical protein
MKTELDKKLDEIDEEIGKLVDRVMQMPADNPLDRYEQFKREHPADALRLVRLRERMRDLDSEKRVTEGW